MAEPFSRAPLRAALHSMRDLGVIPAVGAALDATLDKADVELKKTVLDEIPAFSESANPDILPELGVHARRHIDEIRGLFMGQPSGTFSFVVEHARRRAEQRFPLEAVLHAYRCGHKVLARWLRNAAVAAVDAVPAQQLVAAIDDFAIEYTDCISRIVAAEYVARTRALANADGDRRTELMNFLLQGYDESDGRVARVLRRSGYLEQRQAFCVVLARSADPREMENPARARRMADALEAAVRKERLRSLIGVRDDCVTAIFSTTRRMSGWTAPQSGLADRLQKSLLTLGPAALVGLSGDVPSTSHIPRALEESQHALDFATVGERVVAYGDIPLRRLVMRAASDSLRSALPAWVSAFVREDEKAKHTLSKTLDAYAMANMNVQRSAKELGVHPNTIYLRLQKVADITGLNALEFYALSELLLGIELSQQHS